MNLKKLAMKDKMFENINKNVLKRFSEEGADFLDSYLENEGYDLNDIKSISNKCYKKQNFLIRGQLAYERDRKLLERVSENLQGAIDQNLEKPIAYLKNLIQTNQLGVQYRNLDKLSLDEIRDMIKNQNLIELLEMLENEDKSQGK